MNYYTYIKRHEQLQGMRQVQGEEEGVEGNGSSVWTKDPSEEEQQRAKKFSWADIRPKKGLLG